MDLPQPCPFTIENTAPKLGEFVGRCVDAEVAVMPVGHAEFDCCAGACGESPPPLEIIELDSGVSSGAFNFENLTYSVECPPSW